MFYNKVYDLSHNIVNLSILIINVQLMIIKCKKCITYQIKCLNINNRHYIHMISFGFLFMFMIDINRVFVRVNVTALL